MRNKGVVGVSKARSKVGFDTGVLWIDLRFGWRKVLPLQGKRPMRGRGCYQPAAPLGQGETPCQ